MKISFKRKPAESKQPHDWGKITSKRMSSIDWGLVKNAAITLGAVAFLILFIAAGIRAVWLDHADPKWVHACISSHYESVPVMRTHVDANGNTQISSSTDLVSRCDAYQWQCRPGRSGTECLTPKPVTD